MEKMNPEVKAAWVAALRSGEYKQGKGRLRDEKNKFCCAGVLCNLHAQAHPEIAAKQIDPEMYMGHGGWLPEHVKRWSGLSEPLVTIGGFRRGLPSHNDNGHTFAEIADAIEAQL